MLVQNRTAYPDAEVASVIRRGMGEGPVPGRVVVSYRSGPDDDRQGFTPFDNRQPTTMHLDRPSRYPQTGAKSWRDELITTAGHEVWHFRHPTASCAKDSCEILAERHGQGRRGLLMHHKGKYLGPRMNPGPSSRSSNHLASSGGTLAATLGHGLARRKSMARHRYHSHPTHPYSHPVGTKHERGKRRTASTSGRARRGPSIAKLRTAARRRTRDSFGRFK